MSFLNYVVRCNSMSEKDLDNAQKDQRTVGASVDDTGPAENLR